MSSVTPNINARCHKSSRQLSSKLVSPKRWSQLSRTWCSNSSHTAHGSSPTVTTWQLCSLVATGTSCRSQWLNSTRKVKLLMWRSGLWSTSLINWSQESASLTVRSKMSTHIWHWWWVKDGHLSWATQSSKQLVDPRESSNKLTSLLRMVRDLQVVRESTLLQTLWSTRKARMRLSLSC